MVKAERPVLLELKGVSVRYSAQSRLISPGGFDLQVRGGELLVIVGPSGSGKSTLALTLAGLIPRSLEAEVTGEIRIPVGSTARVGIVFQDPDAQVVTDSVLDEVAFGLENYQVPADQIEARVVAALQRVGLGVSAEDLTRDPFTLSGGQRQRLALACVLALQPDVIIFDEPTANLDPQGRREIHQLLPQLCQEGQAVVTIEHSLDGLVDQADRVLVVDDQADVVVVDEPRAVFGKHLSQVVSCGKALPTAVKARAEILAPDSDAFTAAEVARTIADAGLVDRLQSMTRAVPQAPRTEKPALTLCDVGVAFGDKRVLNDVSLDVYPGEFLAVAGPNGAGKTTLLRAAVGVQGLAAGDVLVADKPIADLSAAAIAEEIGFVFQNPEHQFVTMAVWDELAHGLRVRHVPEEEVARRVEDMLVRLRLESDAKTSPFALSHGQKRRLSVGTALICGPRVLLLDEPTYGQDERGLADIRSLIQQLLSDGVAIVAVSHDLQFVSEMATRMAVLSQGRVVREGPAHELLADEELMARAALEVPPLVRLLQLARSMEESAVHG